MRETFGARVEGFRYAFVMPTHGEGWESNALVPAEPDPLGAPATPRRRAGDRKPTYIEIKPRTGA